MSSLLAIESIHEFPIRSIDFVLAFPQADLGFYVLVEITLGVVVDGNRVECVLKLKNSLYGLNQASANCSDLLKLVYKVGVTINIKFTLVYFTENNHLF